MVQGIAGGDDFCVPLMAGGPPLPRPVLVTQSSVMVRLSIYLAILLSKVTVVFKTQCHILGEVTLLLKLFRKKVSRNLSSVFNYVNPPSYFVK